MDYKVFELENGLRLVNTFLKNSNSVTVTVLVKVGSRYEELNQLGIAHFLEHMMFKGGGDLRSSREVALAIELLGGQSNAYTSYEYTGYYIKSPVSNFSKALNVLSKLVTDPVIKSEDLEKERGVIIEEIRGYQDIPIEKAKDAFTRNLYPNNNLGNDIAGLIETVESIQTEQLLSFFERFYSANNLVVSIAGPIPHQRASNEVSKLFGVIPSAEISVPDEFKKQTNLKELEVINHKTEQAHVVIGGYGLRRGHKLKYANKIGNCVLSYGFGSRFFQVLREELGIVYFASLGSTSFFDVGKYSVTAGMDKFRLEEGVSKINDLLDAAFQGGFGEQEIERAKNFYKGVLTNELETSDDISGWVASQLMFDGKITTVGEYVNEIEAVSSTEIEEVWRVLFGKENRIMTVVGPFDQECNIIK